jgi:hypothetical protein
MTCSTLACHASSEEAHLRVLHAQELRLGPLGLAPCVPALTPCGCSCASPHCHRLQAPPRPASSRPLDQLQLSLRPFLVPFRHERASSLHICCAWRRSTRDQLATPPRLLVMLLHTVCVALLSRLPFPLALVPLLLQLPRQWQMAGALARLARTHLSVCFCPDQPVFNSVTGRWDIDFQRAQAVPTPVVGLVQAVEHGRTVANTTMRKCGRAGDCSM